jgi:hypothetical protein
MRDGFMLIKLRIRCPFFGLGIERLKSLYDSFPSPNYRIIKANVIEVVSYARPNIGKNRQN